MERTPAGEQPVYVGPVVTSEGREFWMFAESTVLVDDSLSARKQPFMSVPLVFEEITLSPEKIASYYRRYRRGSEPTFFETPATALEAVIAPIVREHFGEDARFSVAMQSGSVVAMLTVVFTGGGIYKFFKDYDKFRTGVHLFVDDLISAGRFLRRAIEKFTDANRNRLI